MLAESTARRLQLGQLIVGAMAVGVLLLTAIVVFMRLPREASSEPARAIAFYALVAVALLQAVIARLALWRSMVGKLRQKWQEEAPPADEAGEFTIGGLFLLTIVSGGLAEGAGLLAAIGFMLTGAWPLLAAVAIVLLLLGLYLPTREKLSTLAREATGQIVG